MLNSHPWLGSQRSRRSWISRTPNARAGRSQLWCGCLVSPCRPWVPSGSISPTAPQKGRGADSSGGPRFSGRAWPVKAARRPRRRPRWVGKSATGSGTMRWASAPLSGAAPWAVPLGISWTRPLPRSRSGRDRGRAGLSISGEAATFSKSLPSARMPGCGSLAISAQATRSCSPSISEERPLHLIAADAGVIPVFPSRYSPDTDYGP